MVIINIILVILILLTLNELLVIYSYKQAGTDHVVITDKDLEELMQDIENYRPRLLATSPNQHGQLFCYKKNKFGSLAETRNSLLFSHWYVGKGLVYRFTTESKIISNHFARVRKRNNNFNKKQSWKQSYQ